MNSDKDNLIETVARFFDRYSDVFNASIHGEPDIENTMSSFADCFIGANPHGVMCGKNDKEFREAMKGGYGFYKKIGITAMTIAGTDITPLDDYHAMAKIRWHCDYRLKDVTPGSVEFENIYFVQVRDRQPKIFAYITPDEQATLRESGLTE